MKKQLSEICCCKSSDEEFVGLRSTSDSLKIYFPLGYFKNEEEIKNQSEDVLRQHILTLFSVLEDVSLRDFYSKDSFGESSFGENAFLNFPMEAYLNVMKYYMEHGYYLEKEVTYKINGNGKIAWGKTIRQIQPIIDKGRLLYLKFIAKHVSHNQDFLITQIHKYCVWEVSFKLGFLFGIETEKPDIDFDYELFYSVLQDKISRSFNDKEIALFSDLLLIVDYLGGKLKTSNEHAKDFVYGVEKFYPLWESMIDKIFSNLNQGESKEDFYPHCYWSIQNESPTKDASYTMRPDTIMRYNNGCNNLIFILDSKYYRYGIDKSTLPTSESINKQLVYGEYIENAKQIDGNCIYNVFLLPYCGDAENQNPLKMKYFGYAWGDWKKIENSTKNYHKIHGIFLDTKSVLKNYRKSKECKDCLCRMIVGG